MLQMVPNHYYQYLQLANTLHTTYTTMKRTFTYPFHPLFGVGATDEVAPEAIKVAPLNGNSSPEIDARHWRKGTRRRQTSADGE